MILVSFAKNFATFGFFCNWKRFLTFLFFFFTL
jgi:hypothetical protein